MTLRRCDSLPTRLREAPIPADVQPARTRRLAKKLPDSNTIPNFNDTPDRDQVIATWKSLQTDVKKIKNGIPVKNGLNRETYKKESVTHNFVPSKAYNNREVRRKIAYDNRHVRVSTQDNDRSSSFPLDQGQAEAVGRGAQSVRRKTLLQRLLSWRTTDCDCREGHVPKRAVPTLRPEDLLCTCGASAVRFKTPEKSIKFAERGRSKSVGYEAAREVTQFRRLVLCFCYVIFNVGLFTGPQYISPVF